MKWRLLLLLLRKKSCSSFVWNSQGAVFYSHWSEWLWFADCRICMCGGWNQVALAGLPRAPKLPSHFSRTTQPPHKYLIAISVWSIQCLSGTCRWASSRQLPRTERPSRCTNITPWTPANTQHQQPVASTHKSICCTFHEHPTSQVLVTFPTPHQRAVVCRVSPTVTRLHRLSSR